MLIYEESFVAAMSAMTEEAQRLGAERYGSEHALLGLLRSRDAVTVGLTERFDRLRLADARAAVAGAWDDRSHLERLGIEVDGVQEELAEPVASRSIPPRKLHTVELQAALNESTAKWRALAKAGRLARRRRLGSAELWLAALEPTARSSRLLEAMDLDPGSLRAEVLRTLTPDGAPVPEWPVEVRRGLAHRAVGRLFERLASTTGGGGAARV